MDNFLNFFLSDLQKTVQWAKKCIKLLGEYFEKIPSLVAVACFLPGRAKDLSGPPRMFVTERQATQHAEMSSYRINPSQTYFHPVTFSEVRLEIQG